MSAPVQKPGRSKQDYGTPREFLAAVRKVLFVDDFDIDLAASHENAVTARYYTEADNALVQPWYVGNGWNWLNPPFARIEPWVRRAYEQQRDCHARTVVLVPAGVGSNWWRDWVHHKAQVWLLNGRLAFLGTPINPKTGKADPYPKDCALLLYDDFDFRYEDAYRVWPWALDVPPHAETCDLDEDCTCPR